jgi:shikimate 5-dehydrogenase
MNHKHRATLHALFAHPMSSNIDPKIVKSMLEELGAEITYTRHNHLLVTLNGFNHGFHDIHHSLPKDEVAALRKFLTDAGVDPVRDFPL